uniref:MATH domain-containing protein n=1 Tax=Rhizophora mucronata TaxID=61149 RepID=A0A2P2MJ11_RHIMU
MAGIVSDEAGVGRSIEGISSTQHCQFGEALAEWRSSEQMENGIPSTSPPYWDTDDDDDGGPKPSDLYGKYTWKIENFSQNNKRELRSNAFEVGGYKWYILIYPQGCDVCNHLSLFLCVANHDKLLPGWSHFAQFTIAVVNKDPKKSKYSDTLHRFWKKEHDWGWKKFMELSKVSDGFLDAADTLIIKAQVQVIREKADRPFRCLDCQYRRELVRVYLTNVEGNCRRFVEERRGKLGRLIEDKNRWSSLCVFWLGMDQNAQRLMSREKTDVILRVVVKHFFIEKEVTSTLVMDSLYSGLKALEGQTKPKKGRSKLFETEEIPAPIVRVEKDMFVLVDDVLLLLERAAMEPLPPKDEKGPQNRTKEGNSGEDFNKDSIEHDERRLTELGRRTVEIFVLSHIFNQKIEVAYQEAIALRRQEELIREEEAAWLAESEQKSKRVTEKEKKSKKKQAKQKRNNRKVKDKGQEEKFDTTFLEKQLVENPTSEKEDSIMEELQPMMGKPDVTEDASDASDSVDGVSEVLQHDSEERDTSPVNWDTDTSEIHPPTEACVSEVSRLSSIPLGMSEKRSALAMDDSSSTCSTDSVPSVVTNDPYKGSSNSNHQCEKSPSRGKYQQSKATSNGSWATEMEYPASRSTADIGNLNVVTGSGKTGECEGETVVIAIPNQHLAKKEQEVALLQKKLSTKDPVDAEKHGKEKITALPSSPRSPHRSPENLLSTVQLKSENKSSGAVDHGQAKKASSNCPQQPNKPAIMITSPQNTSVVKPDTLNASTLKLSDKQMLQQLPVMSRPSSAPLMPCPRPTASVVSMVQTIPLLACSVSATGQLGPDASPGTHSYAPQSYRNAIIANSVGSISAGLTHTSPPTSGVNMPPASLQPSTMASARMFLPQNCERIDSKSPQSGFHLGMVNQDALQGGPQWMESPQREIGRIMHCDTPTLINGMQSINMNQPAAHGRSRQHYPTKFPTCTSDSQIQGMVTDEFPHLDIINDLLDDEQAIVTGAGSGRAFQSLNDGPRLLNRHFSFPCESSLSSNFGPSTSSSCRLERTRSYHEGGFQRGYNPSGTFFNTLGEFVPQASPLPYANGHIDGLIQNQWQMAGSDLSLVGIRNAKSDGSQYFSPEYANMACGVSGYTVFRPSNGH